MSKWKGVLLAAAPITALLLLAAGARFLPSLQKAAPDDETVVLPGPSPAQGSKPHVKPAPLKPADAKTQRALKQVVSGQIEAFSRNDFASALSYSAPEFQKAFSPEAFQNMVETGYSGLLHSKVSHFETARCSTDEAMMPVFVKAMNGFERGYLYILRRTPQKSNTNTSGWYIEGVSPIAPNGFPGASQPDSRHMTDVRDL